MFFGFVLLTSLLFVVPKDVHRLREIMRQRAEANQTVITIMKWSLVVRVLNSADYCCSAGCVRHYSPISLMGLKLLRWISQGPLTSSAARCSAVP